MIDLNFTGVTAPSFEPAPDGEYRLKLSGCQIKPTNDKENMGASCVYDIIAQGDGGTEFIGKKVFDWQTIQGPKADMGYVKLWLEALIGQELTADFTLDPEQLIGLECDAFVNSSEYKGKTSNGVKYFISPV